MKTIIKTTIFLLLVIGASCKPDKPEIHREYISEPCPEEVKISASAQIEQLKKDGFVIFDYVDEKTGDTIIMQQYFMAFLKTGENRNQTKAEADSLQVLHRAHLDRMYQDGYADISGPFEGGGDLRGITIYNVPTLQMADSLANLDPMMKSGRLKVEIKSWWAGKGFGLR